MTKFSSTERLIYLFIMYNDISNCITATTNTDALVSKI